MTFGTPLSDGDYITRDEMEDALRTYRAIGDGDTIAVDHSSNGQVIRSLVTVPSPEDYTVVWSSYDVENDSVRFFWENFTVPLVNDYASPSVAYATVTANMFVVSLTDFSQKFRFWLGSIDGKLEMFWSYDGTATGDDTYTSTHQVTAVNSRTHMGVPFRVTEASTSGAPVQTDGDNTAIPTINLYDDLPWDYNSSTKVATVYLNKWNPGLGVGGSGIWSDTITLGNSFSDRIIVGWDGTTSGAPNIDAFANASSYSYTREIGSFATDSSGNLTHGWIQGGAQSQFGATTYGSLRHTQDIDVSTYDQITFNRGSVSYNIRNGVIDKWTTAAISDVILTVDDWTGIEAGGRVTHKASPVTSTSATGHWVTASWTTSGGLSVDGSPVTALTLAWDRKGHLWGVDTTGGYSYPPTVTRYRYRHCTDYPSQSDLIFAAQATGNVIEVSGECYEYEGVTDETATSPTPTVNATYANCTSCTAGAVNSQWKYCSNDADAAVLSPGHTAVDYAYLCLSSAWAKCYNAYLTSTTATDPTVLEQCDDAAPADCTDLVGWPSSDDFGGSGCNSGAVDDTDWTIRWQKLQEDIWTISGNLLQGRKVNAGQAGGYANNKGGAVIATSNFTASVSVSGVSVSSGAGGYADVGLFIEFTDGNWITIRLVDINGTKTLVSRSYFGGSPSDDYSESNSSTSGSFSVVRTGTSWAMKWSGTTKHTYTSLSKTVDKIMLEHYCQNAGDSADADWDDFVLVDGSSAAVRIDPTGVSC